MSAIGDFFTTLSWRLPGRRWRRLLAFAEAEAESALELRCAAAATEDPARAALYLQHAADEARHAEILARRAALARGEPVVLPRRGHGRLFARFGEATFLAYVYLGERRGRRQFEAHVRFFETRDPALSTALASILSDERRHERYTGELLDGPFAADARAATRRARRADLAQRWRRVGGALTAPLFALLMLVLYVLAAPLALGARGQRAGWQLPEESDTRAASPIERGSG